MAANVREPTVLVIEDSWYMQTMLRDVLEPRGYRVVTTDTVGGAARLVESERPAVALMDIVLPDLDGICGILALRGLDAGLEVIVVSGWATTDMRARAARVGASDFVAKPFGELRLLEAVDSALARWDAGHADC